VCAVTTSLRLLSELDNSYSPVDERVTAERCNINRLLFADDLVLLPSSDQGLKYPLDRFSAECDQVGMIIRTKKIEVLRLPRNRGQCGVQVFLRRVHVTLRAKVRSIEIRKVLNVEPLLLRIERSQPREFGHVTRMPQERLASNPAGSTHGKTAKRSSAR